MWSSFWMSGSATLTTVMSSRSMKMATQTMMSARHFRSMGPTLLKKDSATLIRKVSGHGAHAFAPAPVASGEDG